MSLQLQKRWLLFQLEFQLIFVMIPSSPFLFSPHFESCSPFLTGLRVEGEFI